MICVICKKEIEKQYTPDGVMYWDQGHNAQPISDGRCCTSCNDNVVLPDRLTEMKMALFGNLYKEDN